MLGVVVCRVGAERCEFFVYLFQMCVFLLVYIKCHFLHVCYVLCFEVWVCVRVIEGAVHVRLY